MKTIINLSKREINIVNSDELIISKLYFIPSYFIWEFSSNVSVNNPVILTKEDNDAFYSNLNWLMNQSYSFPHNYSFKSDDKLIWFSEHCFNIEDEMECNQTPRLIIERADDSFIIYYSIPFIEQNNLPNRGASISFAPAGNGYLSRNLKTGYTLQDDLINVFYNTLNNHKIVSNKMLIKK